MEKISKVKFIFITLLFFGFFGFVKISSAAITLPYSTSALSCGDFTQTNNYLGPTGCDSIELDNDRQCDSSHGFMVTSSANYSGGAGGKGFRSWYGPAENQGGAYARLNFSPRPTELWIRYYVRWQAGVSWSGLNQKMFYIYLNNNVQALFNMFTGSCLFTAQNSNDSVCNPLQCECYYNGTPRAYCPASDWKTACGATSNLGFSGSSSNGAFQLVEFHFKTNTTGQKNGVFEYWANNVLVYSKNTINWGGGSIDYIDFPSNNHALSGLSGCSYYDQDDIAFSTTGRIGPLGGGGGGDTTPPAAPSGLSVQ